ncbi:MAG: hypothetical protein CFH34_00874 [Alphaproteobacteria bacterium MarineAlpha9_Bin4]|nr:MAG: hypothetical protein CFH34_00874 [Alphaproteobacteria bacterium MarineAlpha9_Bin4]
MTAAWFTVFYDFHFKKLFSYLLILPIAIPPYAVAYCYADITDKGGIISQILEFLSLSQFNFLIPSVRSVTGAIFILSITLFPYVYLIAKFSLSNNSRKIIEAAANLGINRKRLFFNCALPLCKPAIIAGLALVMMESMADFGVVHYLGVDSLSVGIYKSWFGLGDFNSAARLATILFILAFIVLFTENLFRKKNEGRFFSFDLSNQDIKIFSNKPKVPFLIILTLIIITFLIPLSWLISNSISLVIKESNLLLLFFKASLNSIFLAFVGSIIITSFAAIICFTQRIYGGFLNFFLNLAKIGYASPGIVIALGVITPIVYFDKKIIQFLEILQFNNVGLIISGSFFVLIFAYLTRFLAVAFNPIEAAYQKVNRKLDFAAINLGAKRNELFFKIHIPMLTVSFLISFLLVFIDILKELPATLILRPFNFNTLSILTFEYASSEQLKMAAISSLLIMIFATIPLIFIHLIFRRKKL